MKRNLFTIFSGIAFLSVALIGCNKQQEVSTATTVRIDGDDKVEIFVGDTTGFKFVISPADANAMVTWSSDDNGTKAKMLSVDSVFNTSHRYVKFVGLQPGEIKVYATVNGNPTLTDTCTLIVKELPKLIKGVYAYEASDPSKLPINDTIRIKQGYSDTLGFNVKLDGYSEPMSFSEAAKKTSAEMSAEWGVGGTNLALSGDGVFVGLSKGIGTISIKVSSKFETPGKQKKETENEVVYVAKVE